MPTMCLPTDQAHSISIQLFIGRLIFCDFLISAALRIQRVDLRYYATFPGGDGHCHLPAGTPFLDTTVGSAADRKLPTWDTIPEERRGRCPGILSLHFLPPDFLSSKAHLSRRKGNWMWPGLFHPDTVGAPCSFQLEKAPQIECHSNNGDVFLPRGLSI